MKKILTILLALMLQSVNSQEFNCGTKGLAPIHIKTKAEFEKDRFEVENALNKFCLKYPDLIMGFSVRHNSVMHPSVIDECGLGLPIFSVKPMITGEVLDRDYK